MKKSILSVLSLLLIGCPSNQTPPAGSLTSASASPSAQPNVSPTVQPTANSATQISPLPSAQPSVNQTTTPTITTGVDSSPSIRSDGLVAYFPFNGNAEDESGNKVDSFVEGAILTTDRFGIDNKAYRFNGESAFIRANININPANYNKLTMTAWVRLLTKDVEGRTMQIISHDDGDFDRSFGFDDRGEGLGWSAFAGTGGVLGFRTADIGIWTFLAVVYDQDNRTVELYVNDQNVLRKTNAETGIGLDFLRIGSNPEHGEYFEGDIDEVRIYNGALHEKEIRIIYELTNN